MNRLTIVGLAIVLVLLVVAIFAPWLATHDVGATNLTIRYLPPSFEHLFGTDSTGRDIFSRVVFGARISLEVGIIVVSVSAVVGVFLGALAGYYGGWIDRVISGYVFNVFLAFPGLLLAIAMVAFLGAGLNKLIFALCIIGWVGYARLIRGQVLKVREYDFVQAARAPTPQKNTPNGTRIPFVRPAPHARARAGADGRRHRRVRQHQQDVVVVTHHLDLLDGFDRGFGNGINNQGVVVGSMGTFRAPPQAAKDRQKYRQNRRS